MQRRWEGKGGQASKTLVQLGTWSKTPATGAVDFALRTFRRVVVIWSPVAGLLCCCLVCRRVVFNVLAVLVAVVSWFPTALKFALSCALCPLCLPLQCCFGVGVETLSPSPVPAGLAATLAVFGLLVFFAPFAGWRLN